MKKILLSFVLISSLGFSQSIESIAEMEMKSSLRTGSISSETFRDSPENIDVNKYDIHLDLNDESQFTGTTKIYGKALENVTELTFDAKNNINISEVLVQPGNITAFTRNANSVTIQLNESLTIDEEFTAEISYNSSYSASSGLTKDSQNGTTLISSLSEPYDASTWWVGIDNLKDKADEVNMYVTHPTSFKVGSNGMLQSVTDNNNETSTTHWHHNYPIPAYLVSIAMTDYVEYNNTANISGTTVPIINYVFAGQLNDEVMSQLDAVPSYMEFFSELVGDYPYKEEKYGHSQWNWGGGMEHSTMSSQVHFGTSLTAHELAHQWFGDKVTCGTWSDIWLNEGFATYFDALLRRHLYGEEFFNGWKEYRLDVITSIADGSLYIPEEDTNDIGRIFSSRLSYNKGAVVLHMLRFTLGDEDFYQAIKNYLVDPELAYGFAITPQLKAHFETESGKDLTEFFNDWVYGEGYPIFDVNLAYNQSNNSAVLTLNQTQSTNTVPFFETDFDVLLRGTNGETELRKLSLTENGQTFQITDIPFSLASYKFNPNFDVLCTINSETLGTQNLINNRELSLQLYPNPVKDFMNIMYTEKINKVEIYNSLGQLMLSDIVNDTEKDLYIKDLTKGTYILKAYTNSGVESKKFIKQ